MAHRPLGVRGARGRTARCALTRARPGPGGSPRPRCPTRARPAAAPRSPNPIAAPRASTARATCAPLQPDQASVVGCELTCPFGDGERLGHVFQRAFAEDLRQRVPGLVDAMVGDAV